MNDLEMLDELKTKAVQADGFKKKAWDEYHMLHSRLMFHVIECDERSWLLIGNSITTIAHKLPEGYPIHYIIFRHGDNYVVRRIATSLSEYQWEGTWILKIDNSIGYAKRDNCHVTCRELVKASFPFRDISTPEYKCPQCKLDHDRCPTCAYLEAFDE